ncbi:hypothetical protein GCM10010842_06710 [Deinococcus daejeonensis]|uniref:Uncharacterized protein n=1 Tax=Deinococcus daejeonensis TaxID=1007098 RepID=A0ABQ2IUI0_9DEIO|nr:hypothetical protein GCM10010842_06710 [Deinococcus daejeonensis]
MRAGYTLPGVTGAPWNLSGRGVVAVYGGREAGALMLVRYAQSGVGPYDELLWVSYGIQVIPHHSESPGGPLTLPSLRSSLPLPPGERGQRNEITVQASQFNTVSLGGRAAGDADRGEHAAERGVGPPELGDSQVTGGLRVGRRAGA